MILKKLKNLSQAGDTIVEVVIAITVLGIVLGTAAVTANHNANSLQDTQEHTVALKLAQSQLEYFRQYIQNEDHMKELQSSASDIYPGKKFCLRATGEVVVRPANHADCRINSGGTPVSTSDSDIAYGVTVELKSDTGAGYIANVNVGWEGLRTANPNVGLSYRFHETIGASIGGSAGGMCPAGHYDMGPPLGCVRTCGYYGMVALDGTDGFPAPNECGHAPTVTLSHQELSSSSSRFTWTTTGDFNQTECKYDNSPWMSCSQPRTVSRGNPGETHTFSVRVFGVAGEAQDSESWTVPIPPPASPNITAAITGAGKYEDGNALQPITVTVYGASGATAVVSYSFEAIRTDKFGNDYSVRGARDYTVALGSNGIGTLGLNVYSVNRDCVSFPACPVTDFTLRARQTKNGLTSGWSNQITGHSYSEWSYVPVSYWPTIQYAWRPVNWVTWFN